MNDLYLCKNKYKYLSICAQEILNIIKRLPKDVEEIIISYIYTYCRFCKYYITFGDEDYYINRDESYIICQFCRWNIKRKERGYVEIISCERCDKKMINYFKKEDDWDEKMCNSCYELVIL